MYTVSSLPVSPRTISEDLLVGIGQRIQTGRVAELLSLDLNFNSVTVNALLEFSCQVDACHRNGDQEGLDFLKMMGRKYPLLARASRDLRRGQSDTARRGLAVYEERDLEWCFLHYKPIFDEGDPRQSESDAVEVMESHFYQRFQNAMTRHGFTLPIAKAITATFKEMCDNVFQHSGQNENTPAKGLAAYHVGQGWSVYSVADTGRGALASLTTNPKWAYLESEANALQAVATKKASRRSTWTEGGFQQVFRALIDFNGVLRLRSGDASLRIEGDDAARTGITKNVPYLPGFIISVRCCTEFGLPEYGALI